MKLPTVKFTKEQEMFREEVRQFLQNELQKGTFKKKCDSWLSGSNPQFSKLVAKQGWIGICLLYTSPSPRD